MHFGKTKTIDKWGGANNQQFGGGRTVGGADGEESLDESSIDEDNASDDGGDTTDESHGSDEDATEDDGSSDDDENWVFNKFLADIDRDHEDSNEDISLTQRQDLFRKRYADFLVRVGIQSITKL